MPSFLSALNLRARRGSIGSVVNVKVALLPEMLGPLDTFCARQGGISRSEAIRLLLRDGLLQADAFPEDTSQDSSLEPEASAQQVAA